MRQVLAHKSPYLDLVMCVVRGKGARHLPELTHHHRPCADIIMLRGETTADDETAAVKGPVTPRGEEDFVSALGGFPEDTEGSEQLLDNEHLEKSSIFASAINLSNTILGGETSLK